MGISEVQCKALNACEVYAFGPLNGHILHASQLLDGMHAPPSPACCRPLSWPQTLSTGRLLNPGARACCARSWSGWLAPRACPQW